MNICTTVLHTNFNVPNKDLSDIAAIFETNRIFSEKICVFFIFFHKFFDQCALSDNALLRLTSKTNEIDVYYSR